MHQPLWAIFDFVHIFVITSLMLKTFFFLTLSKCMHIYTFLIVVVLSQIIHTYLCNNINSLDFILFLKRYKDNFDILFYSCDLN